MSAGSGVRPGQRQQAGPRLGLVMVTYTLWPRGAFINFPNGGIAAAALILGSPTAEIKINLCFPRNAIISALIAGLASPTDNVHFLIVQISRTLPHKAFIQPLLKWIRFLPCAL